MFADDLVARERSMTDENSTVGNLMLKWLQKPMMETVKHASAVMEQKALANVRILQIVIKAVEKNCVSREPGTLFHSGKVLYCQKKAAEPLKIPSYCWLYSRSMHTLSLNAATIQECSSWRKGDCSGEHYFSVSSISEANHLSRVQHTTVSWCTSTPSMHWKKRRNTSNFWRQKSGQPS